MKSSHLISFAAPVTNKIDIREFNEKCIGIDGETFIKATVDSIDLNAFSTDSNECIIENLISNIEILKRNGINMIFVFEGATIPFKKKKLEIVNIEINEMNQKATELIISGCTNKAKSIYKKYFQITFELISDIDLICNWGSK